MKFVIKPIVISALLAALTALSQAQPAQEAGGATPHRDTRAGMQEHTRQRAADIKAKLKLNPEQESAWTSYMAAMKPPANLQRPDRADLDKLTTPERLDKMRELRKQRDAEMDKREDATRAFYASLTSEQQKTFDANTGRAFHKQAQQAPRRQ